MIILQRETELYVKQMIKYTNHYLSKLEDVIAESDHILRYEKGNFKPGWCLLRESKIIIVNKFYTMEGKITCLVEILRTVQLDTSKMNEKNLEVYQELNQTETAA